MLKGTNTPTRVQNTNHMVSFGRVSRLTAEAGNLMWRISDLADANNAKALKLEPKVTARYWRRTQVFNAVLAEHFGELCEPLEVAA